MSRSSQWITLQTIDNCHYIRWCWVSRRLLICCNFLLGPLLWKSNVLRIHEERIGHVVTFKRRLGLSSALCWMNLTTFPFWNQNKNSSYIKGNIPGEKRVILTFAQGYSFNKLCLEDVFLTIRGATPTYYRMVNAWNSDMTVKMIYIRSTLAWIYMRDACKHFTSMHVHDDLMSFNNIDYYSI